MRGPRDDLRIARPLGARLRYDSCVDGEFALDTSSFPLLVSVFPKVVHREPLVRQLEAYQAFVRARGVPYVSVIDATALETMLSAEARRTIAEYRRLAVERGIAELQRGIVIVSSSVVLRSATSVVQWASPLPAHSTTVATREEAFAWGRAQLLRPP